jgi:hypothetical protein
MTDPPPHAKLLLPPPIKEHALTAQFEKPPTTELNAPNDLLLSPPIIAEQSPVAQLHLPLPTKE